MPDLVPEVAPDLLAFDLVPDALEAGAGRFDAVPEYAFLRSESARWIRAGGEETRADLGRDLLAIEATVEGLTRTGPDLNEMQVPAWDRVADEMASGQAAETEGNDPENLKRARRVLKRLSIEVLMEEDPVERQALAPADPAAWREAAQVIEALQRLDTWRPGTDTPAEMLDALARMRQRLTRRLNGLKRHDRRLQEALGTANPTDATLPVRLQAQLDAMAHEEAFDAEGRVVEAGSDRSGSPYLEAIESVIAEERRRITTTPAFDARALAEVRLQADRAARALQTRGGDPGQLDRLLAQEVALTHGQPAVALPDSASAEARAVDTLAIRRAASAIARAATATAAGDRAFEPNAGLPEIPIYAGPNASSEIVGALRAADQVPLAGPVRGGFAPVPLAGGRIGHVPARWLRQARRAQGPQAPWPGAVERSAPLRPAMTDRAPAPADAPDMTMARERPAPPPLRPRAAEAPALARPRTQPGAPLSIGKVTVEGLGADAGARATLETALAQLGPLLQSALEADPALSQALTEVNAHLSRLEIPLDVGPDTSPAQVARRLADELIQRARSRAG